MASPDQNSSTQKLPVNASEAAFARDFLRTLADDPRGASDQMTSLEAVLQKYAVSDGSGGIDGEETAKKLIKSLNEALPDRGHTKRGPDGKTETVVDTRRDLTDEQQVELVNRLSGRNSIADAVAALKAPAKDGKPLIEFLYARGNDEYNDFAVAYTSTEFDMMRELFGGVGMGGFIDALQGGAGLFDSQSREERAVLEPLEQGFDLVMGGAGVGNLAAFWGLDTKTVDGESVDRTLNDYNAPTWRGPEGGQTALAAFFKGVDDTSARDRAFGDPLQLLDSNEAENLKVDVQSFDSLVMQRWVDLEIISFPDAQARIDANTHAANIAMGMDITPQHAAAITAELKADNLIPAGAAGALATFLDTQVDTQNWSSALGAERAVEYLKDQGVKIDDPEALEATLREHLGDFTAARTSEEFALRMREYIDAKQLLPPDPNAVPENDPHNPDPPQPEAASVHKEPLTPAQLQQIQLPNQASQAPVAPAASATPATAQASAQTGLVSIYATQGQIAGDGVDIDYGRSVEMSVSEISSYLRADHDGDVVGFRLGEDGQLDVAGIYTPALFEDENVNLQLVDVEGEHVGYFVSGQNGEGVYFGADAFDLEQLKADKPALYDDLRREVEAVHPAPATPAPDVTMDLNSGPGAVA